MNQRIRELAKLAEQYANQQNELYGVDFKTEYDQKFAELIVRECADQVDDYFCDFYNRTAADKIKEHFGVEE